MIMTKKCLHCLFAKKKETPSYLLFFLVSVIKEEYIFFMETIEYFHRGSCSIAAESELFCSDPMNLLVNTSVGMWFAGY